MRSKRNSKDLAYVIKLKQYIREKMRPTVAYKRKAASPTQKGKLNNERFYLDERSIM